MEVRAALRMLSDNEEADLKAVFNDAIAVPSRKKWVTPKTPGQKRYVDAIRKHDMVFAIGPAGTGKSRSEEHTSELQSRLHLVCRLLLENNKAHTRAD